MDREKIMAGIDTGHIDTKVVLMRGREILYYHKEPTWFNPLASAEKTINYCLNHSGIGSDKLTGIIATGIYRDLLKQAQLNIIKTVSEYEADARGALFLDGDSETIIDAGGNIVKVIHYSKKGDLLDVIENDKCADGLGIFFKTMTKTLGLNEEQISDLALKSEKRLQLGVQCGLSAELDAIDLISQGYDISDVADAIFRFIAERIFSMCTYIPKRDKFVIAGGLARSKALIYHLSILMERELKVLENPEYIGAIGAALSYEGGEFNE